MIYVRDIVSHFLRMHGYDGLYNEGEGECACDGSFCSDGPYATCCVAWMNREDGTFIPDACTFEEIMERHLNSCRAVRIAALDLLTKDIIQEAKDELRRSRLLRKKIEARFSDDGI